MCAKPSEAQLMRCKKSCKQVILIKILEGCAVTFLALNFLAVTFLAVTFLANQCGFMLKILQWKIGN